MDDILPIGEITSPYFNGVIGVHPYPGKIQGLAGDLQRIKAWGASFLITFVEQKELVSLGIDDLGEKAVALGFKWFHLPIDDFGCPAASGPFEDAWQDINQDLQDCLKSGGRVALHCKGGFGRSGSLAARLLIEFGHDPNEAISLVRQGRGSAAIETKVQEDYLHNLVR